MMRDAARGSNESYLPHCLSALQANENSAIRNIVMIVMMMNDTRQMTKLEYLQRDTVALFYETYKTTILCIKPHCVLSLATSQSKTHDD